ncbi:MAG: diaminopimelate epimerase [Clostridiales bacterium]|jgi:carbamoyl-phosphate synthase large subunit|nr:diaminopimelate epimerase [Clostridiales bacterium]
MEEIEFYKYEGCGNDYVYIDCMRDAKSAAEMAALARRLSDRHFSVGGDGVVFIESSSVADAKMRMFNADGSEGRMCGNAIRCVAKYLYDHKDVKKDEIAVDTLSGVKRMKIEAQGGALVSARVDMGAPILDAAKIPSRLTGERVAGQKTELAAGTYAVTLVSMGNPHCVIFVDDAAAYPVAVTGPLIEKDRLFPEGVNTEFVQFVDRTHLKMRVWERGSGETMACGTGACAAVVAAVLNGLCERGADVDVALRGGTLTVRYDAQTVYMTGPAREAFCGTVRF